MSDPMYWQDQNGDSVIDYQAFDTTGDGVPDSFEWASRRDGFMDTFSQDANGDGNPEGAQFDRNHDGAIDAAWKDPGSDGTMDGWYAADIGDGQSVNVNYIEVVPEAPAPAPTEQEIQNEIIAQGLVPGMQRNIYFNEQRTEFNEMNPGEPMPDDLKYEY